MTPEPVWIDTDIIFNRIGKDVDDGLALMMLLASPKVHIVGISLTIGVDNGYEVTRRFLDYYGRYPIPVYKGEDDPDRSFGRDTEAVQALAEALTHQPLRIIALGTATNIATLFELYPQTIPSVREVLFCAGRRPAAVFHARGSSVGLPDANFDNDAPSMQKVIAAGVPVVLSGFEASSSIYLHHEDITRIRKRGRPGDSWVYRRLLLWWLVWKVRLRVDGFIPFDACTVGHVLFPEYFHYDRDIPIKVSVRENDAPDFREGANKPYLEVSYDFESPHRVDFVSETLPEYKQVLMQSLLASQE